MSEIEWVKGCPEQLKYYLIPHPEFGDVVIVRVPTPDIFENNSCWGGYYEEDDPVGWAGESWTCLEWNGDRNEFVLAQSSILDILASPAVQRQLLEIVYGEAQDFQLSLFSDHPAYRGSPIESFEKRKKR